MRTKFTKASQKDKTLVTVNLTQFDNEVIGFDRGLISMGDEICLTIEGQDVIFTVNRVRNGLAVTAKTYCFPRFLSLPRVGRPVFAACTAMDI